MLSGVKATEMQCSLLVDLLLQHHVCFLRPYIAQSSTDRGKRKCKRFCSSPSAFPHSSSQSSQIPPAALTSEHNANVFPLTGAFFTLLYGNWFQCKGIKIGFVRRTWRQKAELQAEEPFFTNKKTGTTVCPLTVCYM